MLLRRAPCGGVQRLLFVYLVVWVVSSTHGAPGHAQDLLGPCEPSCVQQRSRPRATPVAYRLVDTAPEALPVTVRLEWLGHSSCLSSALR